MKFLVLFISLFSFSFAFSQSSKTANLAKYSYAISKTGYKAGDTVDFIINVKIKDGWLLYSTEFAADGPIKFNFTLDKNADYVQAGAVTPYKPFAHYDEVWEAETKFFEGVAQFRIPLIIKKTGKIMLKAGFEGQLCADLCVPVNEKINVDLSTLPYSNYIASEPSVYKHYQTK